MPPYATSGTNNLTLNTAVPSALYPGDYIYLFGTGPGAQGGNSLPDDTTVGFEAVNVGERSIACQLADLPSRSPGGVHILVITSANPGAAEIDVQDAAVDADGAYITQSTSAAYKITTWTQVGASANWIGSTELQPEGGRFISLKVVANPNAVQFKAKLSYQ